jgi:hypothetical protein
MIVNAVGIMLFGSRPQADGTDICLDSMNTPQEQFKDFIKILQK